MFQVPMQYCSLQHCTLLPSPVTSIIGCCFHFGSASSFLLELSSLFCSILAPTDLGSLSFSVLSFCLFILLMWFSRQEYWSVSPFPSLLDHVCQNSQKHDPCLTQWNYEPCCIGPPNLVLEVLLSCEETEVLKDEITAQDLMQLRKRFEYRYSDPQAMCLITTLGKFDFLFWSLHGKVKTM